MWGLSDNGQYRISEFGLGGIYANRMKLHPRPLPSGVTFAPTFPYEPEPSECNLTVIIYSTVNLSEFDVPIL